MKRMIGLVIALILLVFYSSSVLADEGTPQHSQMSLGASINNIHDNMGVGFTLTSPYFWNDRFAIRFSGNLSYFEAIPAEGNADYDWMPYATYKLGLVSASQMINDSIRLYSEAGMVYLVPDRKFSENNASGGYGLFGFEFFWDEKNGNPVSYFIELGGMGVGARAEKLAGKPLYSNGFTTSAGFRFHL